jgi:hypothetical protein
MRRFRVCTIEMMAAERLLSGHIVERDFEVQNGVHIDVGVMRLVGESAGIFGDDEEHAAIGAEPIGEKGVELDEELEGGLVHEPSAQRDDPIEEPHERGLDPRACGRV